MMADTLRFASEIAGLVGGASFALCFALSLIARVIQ